MNKRLAIVNHNLGSGGAEKLIYDMALELKDRKVDFSVILLTSVNDIYGKKLIEEGIDVKFLSNKWDIYSLKNILRLKSSLKNYDIIHTHTYAAQLWTAFASLFLKKNKKYITTEHSTYNNRRDKIYFRYLDRWMYSRYTILVSITENVQKELEKWIGLKLNYEIIKNGINLDKYINSKKASREDFNLNSDDILICQVARFNKLKKHETTLEALKLLPKKYKVVFLGEGDTKLEMQNLAKDYDIEERVRFLGYRDDIPQIIKMCNVSILTSEYEGLPISAIEAMCSNPFIGSDVIGINDIVKIPNLLYKYQNSDELAEKILKLQKDTKLYKDMKEKCKEIAIKYDIKLTVDNYITNYSKALKNDL